MDTNTLIKQYVGIVQKIARVEHRRIPNHMIEYEELVSIGVIAVQTLVKNKTEEQLEKYLKDIADIPIDAYIIADLGVLSLVKKISPDRDIHISTQASVVSAVSAVSLLSTVSGAGGIRSAYGITFSKKSPPTVSTPTVV